MAAPAQVTTPSPGNHAYGTVSPTLATLTWAAASGATSYNVYFKKNGTSWTITQGQVGLSYPLPILEHGTLYQWRVDSVNVDGVTTGVAWDFSTLNLVAPIPDEENTIKPLNHLVAVSNNQVWYESV
jgi:hypothetical protein